MFLLEWYRELTRIRAEARGLKINLQHEAKEECKSCEILRQQLEIANYEKERLLNRLLDPQTVKTEETKPEMITRPRTIPWAIRKQMLEAEDREKARLLRDAPKPESIEDLEKELGIAEQAREAKASS